MGRISVRLSARAATFGALLFVAPVLGAQSRLPAASVLVGMVKDSAGIPLQGVEVWLRGTDLYAHTGADGGFRLAGVPAGSAKVMLRRLGFEQATVDLDLRAGRTDSLVVSLTAVVANLPGVVVEADARSKQLLPGFWDRRSKGFGHFFTRDEIEAAHPQDFTDILRTTPGVNITSISGRRQVRFSRAAFNTRGDCPPQYWVDGMRVENASADEFPPQDVEALEVYAGAATIPSQFAPRAVQVQKTCGAIVIWTRLPGT
jgi:Carboxypeptidase regulatory-like domain/TonB-dependent Receptor Plug Domain